MKIISLGGIPNDGVSYNMWLARPFSQPTLKLEKTDRDSGAPLITAARRETLTMEMIVEILGGNDEVVTWGLREAALAAWDSEKSAVCLVVANDDGANERYRYVVVQAADEQKNEDGPGQLFALTLTTHDETSWRSTTEVSLTWNATANGDTFAVNNPSHLPARPRYTFRPTAAKTGGVQFKYKMFCSVVWQGRTVKHYPIEVTGSGWDTSALVTSGHIYAGYGENNIALVVDGRLTRRWVVNYNDSATTVWANLDWSSYLPTQLLTSIGAGDSITQIEAAADISTFPRQGILQIGSERFTYTDRDDENRLFLGVTRAARGSSAAAHTGHSATGDTIYWIQHDIWLLYGGTGFWTNSYDLNGPDRYTYLEDAYKPIFLSSLGGFSSNSNWTFDLFGQSGPEYANRSAAWVPFGTETEALGEPYESIQITHVAGTGHVGELGAMASGWMLPIAHRIQVLSVIGESQNLTPGGMWRAGFGYYNSAGVIITHLSIPDPGGTDAPVEYELDSVALTGSDESLIFYNRGSTTMFASLRSVSMLFANYPTATLGPETSIYDMALTLENVTTGESVVLTLAMILNDQLEVDTEAHTIMLLSDHSNQYQSLSKSSHRKEILPLGPGMNTLRVVEPGLSGMTIYISFETRSYS